MGAGPGNIKGHYEDLDFHDAHENIFKKCNIPYGGFENLDSLKTDPSDLLNLGNILERKNLKYNFWGWKEPRTTLFLKEYNQLLPTSIHLIVWREASQVVDSLIRRAKKEKPYLYKKSSIIRHPKKFFAQFINQRKVYDEHIKSWLFYNQRIIDSLKHKTPENYKLLHYHQLSKHSPSIIKWLNNTHCFKLREILFSQVFDSTLIAKRACRLKTSSKLQSRVISLERELTRLSNRCIEDLKDY